MVTSKKCKVVTQDITHSVVPYRNKQQRKTLTIIFVVNAVYNVLEVMTMTITMMILLLSLIHI